MRTLTIKIQTFEEGMAESLEAARRIDVGGGYQGEVYSFATLTQLFDVFTPRRWAVISTLQKLGPSTLRGLARALGRDVKRLHEDVALLLEEGILERNEAKKLIVPFGRIHIDVDLKAPETVAASLAA